MLSKNKYFGLRNKVINKKYKNRPIYACTCGRTLCESYTKKCLQCHVVLSSFTSGLTCPPIPKVANATANSSSALSLTVVEFLCIHHYEFPDKNTSQYIMCTTEGEWNVTEISGCKGNDVIYFDENHNVCL